jgi:hypothetical protein
MLDILLYSCYVGLHMEKGQCCTTNTTQVCLLLQINFVNITESLNAAFSSAYLNKLIIAKIVVAKESAF